MNRRDFLGMGAACAVARTLLSEQSGQAERTPADRPGNAGPFRTRGVYFHDGFATEPGAHAPLTWDFATWKRELAWLHSVGINTVEYATMLEFNRLPSTDLERRKIADKHKILDYAHSLGMQFGYLLTNTVLSTVPAGEEPGHQQQNRATTLCPRQPGNFEKTIAVPEFYMDTYQRADFFEEFAADWGGCECGECGVPEYLRYVRALAERLAHRNSKSRLYADTWCISFWRKAPLADGWKAMFDREIAGSRAVMAALPSLPSNVHLALPCHHLYRPLTFTEYGGKASTPVFPTPEDVIQVRKSGRDVLAWPHFLMDDDAYRAASWGLVHSEVRYLQNLLQTLRRTGIDRVIGNLYLPFLQLSNTYAYGCLLANPDRAPLDILHEFARLVAGREDAAALADVLAWMENHSYWQQQMPADGKLPNLPCALTRADAVRIAAQIKPNTSPLLPLPVSAGDWLADLRRSLERMTWAV